MEPPPPPKNKTKKTEPGSAPAPVPIWAYRLHLAVEQAGFIDKRGKIDKKRIADRYGVTPKAVEHWINGAREPRFSVITDLAKATGCSTDWLLGMTDATPFAKDYRPASNDK